MAWPNTDCAAVAPIATSRRYADRFPLTGGLPKARSKIPSTKEAGARARVLEQAC